MRRSYSAVAVPYFNVDRSDRSGSEKSVGQVTCVLWKLAYDVAKLEFEEIRLASNEYRFD